VAGDGDLLAGGDAVEKAGEVRPGSKISTVSI
jgi:hypothetical protein